MAYAEAATECGKQGDMLYFPPNKMQGGNSIELGTNSTA